ncbi:erythromycin esterase family protein [Candidatus Nitrospira bockiana]
MAPITSSGLDTVREAAFPIVGSGADYDPLVQWIGDARFVLIGEASHGTAEFYRERARITKRLIRDHGVTAVAVEADWPDAYRVNRYVLGRSRDRSAREALEDFRRFPTWMWRNREVLEFITWLREHNDSLPARAVKTGFYGLDLYSLHASMAAVLDYLHRMDPEAAARARSRYACFDHFGEDTQRYGYAAGFGLSRSCEEEVIGELRDLRRRAEAYLQRDGFVAEDEYFYAEQNARLVKNAERYYRTMFQGRVSSWNLRDQHMAETLDALVAHLGRRHAEPKVVVWEHNSHLGDARATQMGEAGELNVGQLVRERYGRQARLIGLTTYTGTVTAASDWDAPMERKQVRPALPESYESLFHQVGIRTFLVSTGDPRLEGVLRERRLERAIGVVYLPESERVSHYFYATLPDQFDAVLHVDETHAVEPLDRPAGWEGGEVPETYPTGI